MAGPYYVDLSADFVQGRTGLNSTTEVLTGPGGLQMAIRGVGATAAAAGDFKAAALAAGEILYARGTAALQRLVQMDMNATDGSAWAVGDVVRNLTGAGDHWTGKIVQMRDEIAEGLADDQAILVQLDSAYGLADVTGNLADGIENTTQAESDATLDAAATPGIYITSDGTAADGNISLIGVSSAYAIASPDAGASTSYQAVLDGTGCTSGEDLITTDTALYWKLENLTLQNAQGSGRGIDAAGGGNGGYWFFKHCKFDANGGTGVHAHKLPISVFESCIFTNNGDAGCEWPDAVLFRYCVFGDNTNHGIETYIDSTVSNCLFYGNAHNFYAAFFASKILDSTFDNPDSDNIHITAGKVGIVTYGCRLVNGTYGIQHLSAQANSSNIENYNVFYGNTSGDLNNVISGSRSYGDGTNHIDDGATDDGLDADYNVEDGKRHSSTAVVLNWDE